jgi:hypothetical protein
MNPTPSTYEHIKKLDAADLKLGREFQRRTLASTPLEGNRNVIDAIMARPRNVSRYSVVDRLKRLAERAKVVANPRNAVAAAEFFDGALGALETKDNQDRITELVNASISKDSEESKEARAALGKIIATNVGNLIRASGTWIQWYESQSLGEDEVPYLRNFVPQFGEVRVGTAEGTITTKTILPNLESDERVDLHFLLSDVYRATLFDKYKGNVADSALAVIDIAMDIMEKLDGILQLPFIVGTPNSVYVANFVKDGTPASHFHVSSRIKVANFPAGNLIALTDNGASTKPRFAIIRAIDEYMSRFGGVMDGVGGMTQIHVASGIAHQFGDEFTPTSVANPVTDQMFANRGRIGYNGMTYEVIPDHTLDPTDKHVYVKGPASVGIYFDKPAGSYVHREESMVHNEVTTWERILYGLAIPLTHVPRCLAIRFKT